MKTKVTLSSHYETVENLAGAVREQTACICYCGGDPSPQLPFLLQASRMACENDPDRILRICWEINGAMSKRQFKKMPDFALESSRCIKIDPKAWDETLHLALTGVTNRQTQENFAWLARRACQRPTPPLQIASTLMVPGYIDSLEISKIAAFIAAFNPETSHTLLGFHSDYHISDLPPTSRQQARECLDAAQQAV